MDIPSIIIYTASFFGFVVIASEARKKADRGRFRGAVIWLLGWCCMFSARLLKIMGTHGHPVHGMDTWVSIAGGFLMVGGAIVMGLARRAKRLQPDAVPAVEDGAVWPPAPKPSSLGG